MFTPSAVSANELIAKLIVEELLRSNIDRFFISPGSRSTPLTAVAASDKRMSCSVHVDERGAAFQAIGYARATGKPGVLICTSGTAPSNYYPAILEAEADALPLIVLSADRPPRLQNVSANQTTDQQELYYHHVNSFLNIQPTDTSTDFKNILEAFSALISNALQVPHGAVHVNVMFDEPLAPVGRKKDYSKQLVSLSSWMKSTKPIAHPKKTKTVVDDPPVFNRSNPTVVIAGHLKSQKDANNVLKFSERMNLPVFADIRSKLRFGIDSENIITYYDMMLKSDEIAEMKNLQVIHVGGNIVSKRLLQYIEKADIAEHLVLHDTKDPYNEHRRKTKSYRGNISALLKELEKNVTPVHKKNLLTFQKLNRKMDDYLRKSALPFSEIALPRLVVRNIQKNSFLFSASSMPVRDLDMFAQTSPTKIPIYSNRGLSGIDGTIASFTGLADGLKKPGLLITGDLAFYHDMNSLALVKKSKYPLIVILINNNGGGIFSFLPIAQNKKLFEDYFGTGQNIEFKSIVEGFKLDFTKVKNEEEFVEVLNNMQLSKISGVIEVTSHREENYNLHKKIYSEISELIKR